MRRTHTQAEQQVMTIIAGQASNRIVSLILAMPTPASFQITCLRHQGCSIRRTLHSEHEGGLATDIGYS